MSMYFLYLIYELFINVRGDFLNKESSFNQSAYITAYQKEHYKKFNANIKPELKQEIDDYCSDLGISKPEFLKRAIEALKSQ